MTLDQSFEELLTDKLDITATSHKILDAAERCFQKVGVSETSMSKIMEEANVSRGTLYRYFKNIEQVITLSVIRDMKDIIVQADQIRNRYDTVDEQLVEVFYYTITEMAKRPLLTLLFSQDSQLLMRIGLSNEVIEEIGMYRIRPIYESIKDSGRLRENVSLEDFVDWCRRQIISFQVSPSEHQNSPTKMRQYIRSFLLPSLIIV